MTQQISEKIIFYNIIELENNFPLEYEIAICQRTKKRNFLHIFEQKSLKQIDCRLHMLIGL